MRIFVVCSPQRRDSQATDSGGRRAPRDGEPHVDGELADSKVLTDVMRRARAKSLWPRGLGYLNAFWHWIPLIFTGMIWNTTCMTAFFYVVTGKLAKKRTFLVQRFVPENLTTRIFLGLASTEPLCTQDSENILALGDQASIPNL